MIATGQRDEFPDQTPAPRETAARAAFVTGVIGVFADLAELFGNPRSYGTIYGLLFVAEEALTLEEVSSRLGISQGSASQGLRQLESFGAVIRNKRSESRHAIYHAKLEMKVLIAGFLRERVIPRLESTSCRVGDLEQLIGHMSSSEADLAGHRLERLSKWHRSARSLFPVARDLLGNFQS